MPDYPLDSSRQPSWWEMRFTIFVMKKQTGIQILRISSRKSPQIPRLSLSSTRITQQVPSIQMRSSLEIVEIARQNNLIIFADEIYDRLVMDGENTRLLQV